METDMKIAVIVLFALAGVLLVLAIRHFMERGFLLNNAYIYATKEQRKTMDKKPHYRQSAVCLLLLSAAFAVQGLAVLLQSFKLALLWIPLFFAAVVYGIVSSALISRKKRKRDDGRQA